MKKDDVKVQKFRTTASERKQKSRPCKCKVLYTKCGTATLLRRCRMTIHNGQAAVDDHCVVEGQGRRPLLMTPLLNKLLTSLQTRTHARVYITPYPSSPFSLSIEKSPASR